MTTIEDEQKQLLCVLADSANSLKKAEINLKKCPKSRLKKGYIEGRIHIIEDYWITYKNAHDSLVKITPEESKDSLPHFRNEDFFTYEELYNVLLGDLKDMLKIA